MKKIFLTLNLVLFVIPFVISQGLPSYVPTDGLVAFYGFNGNVIDLTQNGYDGLIHNGQNGTINFLIDRKGISNSAINFNSNPEWNYLGPFVEFQQTSNLCVDSDFSINFFLNLSSNNIRGDVINKGPDNLNGNLLSRVYDNNTLKNGVSQVEYLFTQSDYLEGWKMITITNFDGLWSIYVNGDLSSSGNIGNISNNDSPYFLGAMPSGGSNGSHWPLQGSVDDLGFWNRALTEQEIQNLYTSSTGDIKLNGSVSAENNQIKNVADPTDAQDVTTKSYVDNSVSNTYTQAEVDAIINDLRTELNNQIDNDGDGYTEDGGDCDDSDSEINPVANEVCDNIDNNCNSEIDEGVKNTYYQDVDGDGFGLNGIGPVMSCNPPEGYVSNNQDCDDSNSALYPGALEIIGDGIDNNCNGILDEYIDPRDNNIYRTIVVNGDIWLAEDLRFNSENSHNPFYDDPAVGVYSDVRMYWPDDNDALPDGWRIPTKEEWVNLFNYVGGYKDSSSNAYFNAGGKLKSNKPEDWSLDCLDSHIPGSNEINFNAVSYSFRTLGASGSDINSTDCNYDGRNQGVGWWASTEASVFGPNRYYNYYIHLSNNYNGVTYVCDNDNKCDKIYEYITESKLGNSNSSEHSGRRMLRLIKESN
jgi:uncharacterized protein (TIGR02145 family)